MNLSFAKEFSHESRVWVYQSSRLFVLSEALEIELLLKDFAAQWQSHGVAVREPAIYSLGNL